MSSSKDKNNSKNMDNTQVRADRMYHDCETFLFRYRWWIVLVLAILLAYYLYTRKCEPGETASMSTVTTATVPSVKIDLTAPTVPTYPFIYIIKTDSFYPSVYYCDT